jgi:serine phosphatase RsbU (regulator of sigma subunit)
VLIRNKELHTYKADKQPIGIFRREFPFKSNEVQLQKNDKIYLFSDGYHSQFGGEKGFKLKFAKFTEFILQSSEKTMSEQKNYLVTKLSDWQGTKWEQIDDILVIGITI